MSPEPPHRVTRRFLFSAQAFEAGFFAVQKPRRLIASSGREARRNRTRWKNPSLKLGRAE